MLSRHFLRAKALQALYAGATANRTYSDDAPQPFAGIDFERQMNPTMVDQIFAYNVQRLDDLGIMQLATLPQLAWTAGRIQENAQSKFNPTDEERNPVRHFVDNCFIARLDNCFEFKQHCQRLKIDWSSHFDTFRKVWNLLKSTDQYKAYIEAPSLSFVQDRDFALIAFKALMNDDALREIISDNDLIWDDDFDQIAQYNFMMLKELTDQSMNEAMWCPLVYDPRKSKDHEDYDFALKLTVDTYNHIDDVEPLIRKHLQNWDFDRVALIDILMINMAVTEFTRCPSIPERVTVDEYIELSKEFSTSKSKLFINGILDKILIELRVEGKVNKNERGQYDPHLEQ